VKLLHDPGWVAHWLEEIVRFYNAGPFDQGELLQKGVSEGQLRYAIIAMKQKIADMIAERPELIIIDHIFLSVAAVVLRDIYLGVEPALSIGIFGDPGSGKTTMAFYLTV